MAQETTKTLLMFISFRTALLLVKIIMLVHVYLIPNGPPILANIKVSKKGGTAC
jgi:hypothetical protein